MSEHMTRRIRAFGIVQGVGFRPTVARHAQTAQVTGTVCNKGPYVEIVCQGTRDQLDAFEDLLRHRPPRRSMVLRLEVTDLGRTPLYDAFTIVESKRTAGAIFVSPDIATCDECASELFDPQNRRYLHPFINCTNCGPRLTILDEMPYDRVRTSMGAFPLCPTCASEYVDPTSRRFDAQPVCCNDCGPEVSLLDRAERGPAAITYARHLIADGGIVAVKGIGGFHLCCDATSEAAVRLLRNRKLRPTKPFAVMARDLDVARRECVVSGDAEELLCGHQKPIVLMRRRDDGRVAPAVAPNNPKLGVMLPYAPLQMLLFDYPDGVTMPDCLVMTSANESGAPICRDDEDARRELRHIADAILTHDRLIRVRADDTVTDLLEGRPYMIRRSRGFAPLPCALSKPLGTTVLAIGAELKNTFCVGTGDLQYLSPYVGDLTDVRTVEALSETVERMLHLLEATPQVVACDLHPAYNSTVVAQALADRLGCELVGVQHHFAHVASCMAENDHEGTVVGVSFDGTGYGTDGTIWGGEILVCDTRDFTRAATIAPFAQAGGDASSREGYRIALSLLAATSNSEEEALELAKRLALCDPQEARVVLRMIGRNLNCVRSTSAGRLFDAVSAVLGYATRSTFEGEAATALQFAAERFLETSPDVSRAIHIARETSGLRRASDGSWTLATDALFARIVSARLAGTDPDLLSYAFHHGLAALVAQACAAVAAEAATDVVALTGGCYQNTLLVTLTKRQLEEDGLTVLTHHLVPPNDGGIALGQALVAARLREDRTN